jgi:hypothetical protein
MAIEFKPLLWVECGDLGWCADSILGRYWVELRHASFAARLVHLEDEDPTNTVVASGLGFEDAKIAAQVDYTSRIRAVISETPAAARQPTAWRMRDRPDHEWQCAHRDDVTEGWVKNLGFAIVEPLFGSPDDVSGNAPKVDDMVAWLSPQTYLEVTFGEIDGWEDDCQWRVHRRPGGRNDREYILVAYGETLPIALAKARAVLDAET